jgi:hypothetical protein
VEVKLLQVPELMPEEILVRSGAKREREAFAHIPIVNLDDLVKADALICGKRSPPRELVLTQDTPADGYFAH